MIRFLFVLFLFNIAFPSIHATNNLDLAFSHLEHFENVEYLTYTKINKSSSVNIRDVKFNDDYETVFVIHGFDEKNLEKSIKAKDDIFQFNLNVGRVIIVSWLQYSRGSGSNAYLKVADQHVTRLAFDIYEKIVYIRKNGAHGAIQLVGYSIGAHVAGQTGRQLQSNNRYTLDQIIGLDPAGVYFSEYSDHALHNKDAKKVVVLHTNLNYYGFGSQIGPNDIMVNGGEKQPTCKVNIDKCSHYEAWNALSLYLQSQLEINFKLDGVVQSYNRILAPFNSIPTERREDVIQFFVNGAGGKDAEFTVIGHDLRKFFVKLTSPRGNQFSSSSPEYFSDISAKKGFRIPHAEPGKWSLTVDKYFERRPRSTIPFTANSRSIPFTANSRFTSDIVLNADVSHRVLEYPEPITVLAELKFKDFPIIYAEVYAEIVAPKREPIRLPLYDNGVYPDELANDGIYTNDIIRLPNPERYSVSVTAISNGTAMSPPKEINFLLKDVIDCKTPEQNCTQMIKFLREAEAGSVKLMSNAGLEKIAPQPVSDLLAKIESFEDRIVSLEWTSPRNELFDIQIKRYDIRVLVRGTDFENGVKLDESHVVSGSLDPMNSVTKNEKTLIQIPKFEWDFVVHEKLNELKFALKSISMSDMISEKSNIAWVEIKEEAIEIVIREFDLKPAKKGCEIFYSDESGYSVEVQLC